MTLIGGKNAVDKVYQGAMAYDVEQIDISALVRLITEVMMNIGNPDLASKQAAIPYDGSGPARMGFIFANWIQVHLLALTYYDTLPVHIKRRRDQF